MEPRNPSFGQAISIWGVQLHGLEIPLHFHPGATDFSCCVFDSRVYISTVYLLDMFIIIFVLLLLRIGLFVHRLLHSFVCASIELST